MTQEYECKLRDEPARPVLTMRARMPVQGIPAFLGKAYGAIAAYLAEKGQAPVEPIYAAYYNMDMLDMDVEAGMGVAQPVPGRGDIAAGEIPAGTHAYCLHVGPYDQIQPAYEAVMRFVAAGGRQPTGVAYEIYLNDPSIPGVVPATEVVLPLK